MTNSILFKTSFVIAITLSILMGIVGFYVHLNQLEIIKELQNNKKEYIIKQLNRTEELSIKREFLFLNNLLFAISGTLKEALYNFDDSTLKATFKKLLSLDNIKAIYITDAYTKKIYLAAYKENNKIVFSKKIPKKLKSLNFLELQLIKNDENLGRVRLYYDNKKIINHIENLKQQDLNAFEIQSKILDTKIKKELVKQIIYFIIVSFLIILITILLLIKYVRKPLYTLKEGLESFFKFLSNPKTKIKKIEINTNDEFAEMANFINNSIKVSVQLHKKISDLLKIVNKNIIIWEINTKGEIISVSDAFCNISGFKNDELLHKNINIIHEDKELINNIIEYLQNHTTWHGEILNIKKNKQHFWTDTIITKKVSDNNEISYIAINYDITMKKEIEEIVNERTREIQQLHKMTKSSIEYASLIQYSIIPDEELFMKYFKEYFVIWSPKDIVGGDIYLVNPISEDEVILMVIDCTGHGVAGAFITMIVKSIENELEAVLEEQENISPAFILEFFNKTLQKLLHPKQGNSLYSSVGFDGAILYYNKKENIIKYAGANIPLFYVQNDELLYIKGDRYSVGYQNCNVNHKYTDHTIEAQEGMKFYISTDGFLDQIGEKTGFPFGKKKFKQIIMNYHKKTFATQKKVFLNNLLEHQGDEPRTDDITVIGFRI